ncbi:hypothetical protein ILYODFUR_009718 [Ilyodon furcidens]|uniref:CRIB domain-containing protein n=1 Tax=Ilyodon furcidens TaxID=33524 RepID=A0ABV0SJW8_9TELE
MATIDIKNPEISNAHRFHNNSQMNSIVHASFPRRIKKDNGKRKRLTKADIGTPSNFQHVNHIGWNPNTGFDVSSIELMSLCVSSHVTVHDGDLSDSQACLFEADYLKLNISF